jgi:hypothetical protein
MTAVQALWVAFSRSENVTGCANCPRNLLLIADESRVASAVLMLEQPVLGCAAIVLAA